MKIVDKPWGRELWWAVTGHYVGKIIEVKAGHSLSLQYHRRKLETLLCHQGEGEMILGQEVIELKPGVAVTVEPGTLHRIVARTDLQLFEVSTPEVEDVVRVEDRYGRVTGIPT